MVKKFGRNKQRGYDYIVEAIKIKGKPKQKVIKYISSIEEILKIGISIHAKQVSGEKGLEIDISNPSMRKF